MKNFNFLNFKFFDNNFFLVHNSKFIDLKYSLKYCLNK